MLFRFLNYQRHPEDKKAWVFYFSNTDAADIFSSLCEEREIPVKKMTDPSKPEIRYYSVPAAYFDAAHIVNTEALSRTPGSFIPDKGLRMFLLIIFFVFTGIALTGLIVTKLKGL